MLFVPVAAHLTAVESIVAARPSLHERELAHVKFFQAYASGDVLKGTEALVASLRDYPQGVVC